MPKVVSVMRRCGQRQNNLHLIEFRKLEFQFISSILGILQHALKPFGPVIVLNSFFKFSSLPLVTVGFGLQIVQGAIRKLQFTLLEHVSFPDELRSGRNSNTPVLCIDLGVPFLVRAGDRHVQNSPQGRLPGASSSPQGSKLSVPHLATFSPAPRRLVKIKIVR